MTVERRDHGEWNVSRPSSGEKLEETRVLPTLYQGLEETDNQV